MAYQVFERKSSRMGIPMLSFSKLGQVVFNQPAAAILQKEAVETILILWDAAEKKMAMKTTGNKKDPRSYRIRYNPKGNGASFSAKTFLDHVGIDFSQRKQLQVTIDVNSEYFVEIAIPENFFRKDGIQRVPLRNTGTQG